MPSVFFYQRGEQVPSPILSLIVCIDMTGGEKHSHLYLLDKTQHNSVQQSKTALSFRSPEQAE